MASAVEEEGKQYASTDREESSEEQREPAAVYNVSITKIMEFAGDKYRQIMEKGGW